MPDPTPTVRADLHRSPGGRRIAAALLTVLISAFVGNVGRVVYHDTYTSLSADSRDVDCATGLRRLHDAYALAWAARRERVDAPLDPTLDPALAALRRVCEREGEAAAAAHHHLERWRYRAEGMALLWRESLDDDVRAALAYSSPESPR